MRQAEIDSIANDISNMVVNRVLSKDLTITEALIGILTSPAFICAKTLPSETVHNIVEDGEVIAIKLMSELRESVISPATLVYGLSLVGREVIENTKK